MALAVLPSSVVVETAADEEEVGEEGEVPRREVAAEKAVATGVSSMGPLTTRLELLVAYAQRPSRSMRGGGRWRGAAG